MGLETLKH